MRRLVCSSVLLAAFLAQAGWSQTTAPVPTELSEDSVQALLVRKVAPVYPPLARQARIQGTVILKIVINKAGDVRDVRLYSGHPMLAPAAIEAVKQWKYQPYTKDGEVVEVSTMVRVIFSMPGGPAPTGTAGDAPGNNAGYVPPTPGGYTRAAEAEMQKLRIQTVDPVYPQLAIQARVEGMVVLYVQVNAEGNVEQLRLVSGHPMLAPAAIEAVKQWKYQPYVANGNAVGVATMVRLKFELAANDAGGVARELSPAELINLSPTADKAPRTARPQRIRVSSGVSQGLLVSKVAPEYPEDAREQHVEGMVTLHVNIDDQGNVTKAELISGHPLLAPAAIEAVRQWKYKPVLLNGEAVEVDTQVLVNFVLAQ